MTNMLTVKNLLKNYDDFFLGPLTFSIPKGAIVGYVGENGSEKSTTLKAILNLIHPDVGDIKLFNQPLKSLSLENFNQVGVVLDQINLPKEFTINQVSVFCKYAYTSWCMETFHGYLQRFTLPKNKKIKPSLRE